MHTETPVDVLIVGAGPVGLTMAAALVHHGVDCRIIDKAPRASDKSKALVVWARTLELLDKLGLADTFVRSGIKATGASIYSHQVRLVQIAIADVDSPFNFPLMIPQCETERLLTEHLASQGVMIDRQVELSSFVDQPDRVNATLRHADGREESFDASWLIGCDGAHSTVRHALALPFMGDTEQNDWILADVHIDGPVAASEVSIYWHKAGLLAIFPIIGDRFRVIADIGLAANTSCPADPTLQEVQAKIDERGPTGVVISNPVWLAGFRINERKVADYRRGRVFLAGDSAHIHSPAGGQGMNTGMQDAFNLAWKLALVHRGAARGAPLLDSYSLERSAVGDQVLRGAGMMTLIGTLRNPVAQFLRNHAATVLTSFGFVTDKVKNTLCELTINYRHSPMSVQDWPRQGGGLPSGDRMPDATLKDPARGSSTTLFSLLRDGNFALLVFPGSGGPNAIAESNRIVVEVQRLFPGVLSPYFIFSAGASIAEPAASAPCLIDEDGRLHQRLGITECAVIAVRPDGYIGYRGQPADSGALIKYFERYLVSK